MVVFDLEHYCDLRGLYTLHFDTYAPVAADPTLALPVTTC